MSTISSLTRRAATGPALALTSLLVAGCATNPATGASELSLVGEQQEIQMGREADQQIVAQLGAVPDEALQRYVSDIGQELAARSERPGLPWTFRVIDDASVNAFALPGGFVYVTRGLMAHLTSEAELAGVLAHEIGHITAKHAVNRISRAQLAQLGVGLGMIFVEELRPFGDVAGVGLQLLFLKFSRDDENESDALAVRYTSRLNYDPREMIDVFTTLERLGEAEASQGRVPGWLSTHPDPGDRQSHVRRLVDAGELDLSQTAVRSTAYLRHLDGMIFGPNPREGFFDDENVFYHPDLEFRMAFPRGWRTLNQKQAVQAMSPGQDALMVLTFARESSPRAALDAFARQQGVEIGQTSTRSVGGFPAVWAEFRARTEQGTLRGVVTYLQYGGSVYQLMGYGPEGSWSGNARTVTSSIGSFRRETDSDVLAVQPKRIDLVDLDRSFSVSAFMERYPSDADVRTVALINHTTPNGTLPGGTLAKRLVGGVTLSQR